MRSSIRDIVTILFRHWRKIVSVFAVSVVLVTLLAYLAPDVYQSEAQLLVRFGREHLAVDLPEQERGVTMVHNRDSQDSMVNSELTVLTSRYLLEQVVDSLGESSFLSNGSGRPFAKICRRISSFLRLTPHFTPREQALQGIANNLSAAIQPNSNIIEVHFTSKNRQLAQETLQQLIEDYLNRHIEVNAASASPQFFENQLNEAKNSLTQAERQLDEFRATHRISSISVQQKVLLEQIAGLENTLENATALADASRKNITSLEKILADSPLYIEQSRATGSHNYRKDPIKSRYMELRLRESDLASRYEGDYPPLAELKQQIRILEDILAGEENTHTQVITAINENNQALSLQLQNEQLKLDAQTTLKETIAGMVEQKRLQLAELAEHEVELHTLESKLQRSEELYRQALDNLRRAQVSSELDRNKVSNVSVVQPATTPLQPIRPQRLSIIFLGVLFGILAGIGTAYLAHYFDDTLTTAADAENRLNLPVLAVISDTQFSREGASRPLDEKLIGIFQGLKSRLTEKSSWTITFASALADEGSSELLRAFALLASRHFGKRVVVLHGNDTAEAYQELCKSAPGVSMLDIVQKKASVDDALASGSYPNLWPIALSSSAAPISGMIADPAFAEILDQLRSRADLLLFDAPCFACSMDALPMADRSDGVLLIIEANRTRWQVVANFREHLVAQNSSILGTVVNKQKHVIPPKIYARL